MSIVNNRTLGDKAFDIISFYAQKFTQISATKKYTIIEAHILMFSDFFACTLLKQGDADNPKIDKMLEDIHNKFIELPDYEAKMILLNNGYRSMLQFLVERSMYNLGEGALPCSICFALYHKPLSKIVYHESLEGYIFFDDEFDYSNLPVIVEFTMLYNSVIKQFERDITIFFNKEL